MQVSSTHNTFFDPDSDSYCYRMSINGYVYFFSFLVRRTFGLAFGITRMETAFYLTKRKASGLGDRDLGMVSYWMSCFSLEQTFATCISKAPNDMNAI